MNNRRQVVVTGIGVVSPLGHGPATLFQRLCSDDGCSGIRLLDPPLAQRLTAPVAGRVDFDGAAHFAPPRLRLLDRATQFALVAAASALRSARLDLARVDRARCGVFVGTGMAGTESSDAGYRSLYGDGNERVQPYTVLLGMNHAAAAWIGIEHALAGPSLTISTACSSSAVAIGEACLRIAQGQADVMIAGGTEAPLSLGSLKAWEALHTLATVDTEDPSASCRPFSRDRTGMVLAEGAAFVVLESLDQAQARGAPLLAQVAGYGLTNDPAHITRPSVAGQAAAMRAALDHADMAPQEIGYINAHGTGTTANDAVETAAIRHVFGAHADRLAVSSTKAMHGHLLGAAGALEFVIALLALQAQVAPPTRHLRERDPACDLDYVTEGARPLPDLAAVMSNSFAFGGTNAVLIARAA
jgi:3-oxoacyl-(acyl-carrier-protein) synthase